MTKLETLQKCSLFDGLPQRQLEEMSSICREKEYGKGEVVFFEGDIASGYYVVSRGKIKIYKMSPAGKEHILHIFGPGEPFGEVPVFHDQPYPASAECLEKCRLLFIPKIEFVQLIHRSPSVALNMLAVLSKRLRRFSVQIENLSLKEVPARLAGYLLYLQQEQGGKNTITLEISKGQLASLLGTIPETLSRIFGKMMDEGLIRVEGREITILDGEALQYR